jgi:SAM-dependent methyltransferase
VTTIPPTSTTPTSTPPICDYEGSGYQADFWQGKGRDYEDAVERIAIRKLLPTSGKRAAEFGAGFGRLTEELAGFDQVVLVDYSRSLLQQAQAHWGRDPRFVYVASDVNRLPFANNAFDGATLIRVIHHSPDPLTTLKSIRATLTPSATFVLEFANKRNLKAIARYWTRRQSWSPFDKAAVEFVKLNFDFHPAAMRGWLKEAGFVSGRTLAVSMLRLNALKRRIPTKTLIGLDRLIQPTGGLLPLSPSVFVHCQPLTVIPAAANVPVVPFDQLFVNPLKRDSVLQRDGDSLVCPQTGARWPIQDGIYNFKSD